MAFNLHPLSGQVSRKLRNILPAQVGVLLRLRVSDRVYNRVEERSVGRSLSGRGIIHPIYNLRMVVRFRIHQELEAFPLTFSASGLERLILENGGAW